MATVYTLPKEFNAFKKLYEEATTNEDGEPKELTDDDKKALSELFNEWNDALESKVNNICKFIKNLGIEADIAEAERKSYKDELDRLSRMAKAKENKAQSLIGLLAYLMHGLGFKKYETPLFKLAFQSTKKSVKTDYQFKPELCPAEFLKPAEISASKIQKAVASGKLYEKENTKTELFNRGKLFYKENGVEKELVGVSYLGGEALYIR